MRPGPLVVRAYLARGVKLWIVTRLAVTLVFALVPGADPFQPTTGTSIGMVVLIVVLGHVDIRRHHESVLLGNLGVSSVVLSPMFAAPAMLGEIAFALVTKALA